MHIVRDFSVYAWDIAGVNLSRLVTRIVSDFHLLAFMHGVILANSPGVCV